MARVNRRPDKCREKTRKGNVFATRRQAQRAASSVTRRAGHKINWFRCSVCGFYHIGSA